MARKETGNELYGGNCWMFYYSERRDEIKISANLHMSCTDYETYCTWTKKRGRERVEWSLLSIVSPQAAMSLDACRERETTSLRWFREEENRGKIEDRSGGVLYMLYHGWTGGAVFQACSCVECSKLISPLAQIITWSAFLLIRVPKVMSSSSIVHFPIRTLSSTIISTSWLDNSEERSYRVHRRKIRSLHSALSIKNWSHYTVNLLSSIFH